MEVLRWIGLALAVLGVLSAMSRVFWVGQARLTAVETASAEHFKQSEEHYDHESDDDTHWTKRERNALTTVIGKMDGKLDKILLNGHGK